MPLGHLNNFFHFLLLDIILSFLLLCCIILRDRYLTKNKDSNEEKTKKYQKDFMILLTVGLIVYFM